MYKTSLSSSHNHRPSHRNYAHFTFCGFPNTKFSNWTELNRTWDAAYLLSSVNVNLTISFCILSTNELLKRRQGNNNNKGLKSRARTRERMRNPMEWSEEASQSELFVARAGNCTSYQLNNWNNDRDKQQLAKKRVGESGREGSKTLRCAWLSIGGRI